MEKDKNLSASSTPAPVKHCPKCNTALKSGIKYTDICTTCEPVYLIRCCGCYHILWDCLCVRPHTWE